MGFKREWIQWLAGFRKELKEISSWCSAPDCENVPSFVYDTGNYCYFLCKECADLVRFEKKYVSSKSDKE